jgi:hypothetical protein
LPGVYLRIGRECDQYLRHVFTELEPLFEELVLSELVSKLSEFHSSMSFKSEAEDESAHGGIAFLEGKANQQCHGIAMFPNEATQLSTDFGRLVDEVSLL